jgi:hypothetical protein
MKQFIKGSIFGLVVAQVFGVVGYICVVFYLTSQGVSDSSKIVEIIRSSTSMYLSLPFTFIALLISVWIATRKIEYNKYLIAAVVILLTSLSITLGPVKLMSIHMNYLPIIFGGLLGAYIATKSHKASIT